MNEINQALIILLFMYCTCHVLVYDTVTGLIIKGVQHEGCH